MEMPSPTLIMSVVVLNLLMLTISASLITYFGPGVGFTGAAEEIDISFPVFEISVEGVENIIDWALDSLSLLLSVLTFDIYGIPSIIRGIIVIPMLFLNLYIGINIIMKVVEVLAAVADAIIPF